MIALASAAADLVFGGAALLALAVLVTSLERLPAFGTLREELRDADRLR